ncbi:hypothetical protein [Vibrio parahaemolyticus]|uniref:hypothetical protein n=1 Tax=Vibrio parahaemolyticus TaxID=670 RepID=UPI002240C362|nr:hypothetical protein [Vibrio parahaemolyticus]MDL1991912.1 hypothetical protein [Vibrio parahaemolyticus]
MSHLERRFQQVFDSLCVEDYQSALTLICPLIDGAGKKLYGINKNGERFKKILADNNDFLYWMMSGGGLVLVNDADVNFIKNNKENTSLGQAVYKLVRNSLLHEAELSDKIEFVDDGKIGFYGDGKMVVPKNLIWSLAFMLVYLPCYRDSCPRHYKLNMCGVDMPFQECWGDKDKIMEFFRKEIFKR